MNLSDDQKLELANVDFAGIHQQHAAALGSFNTMLQIVLAIEALPWVVLGALYSRTGSQADPETLIFQHVTPSETFVAEVEQVLAPGAVELR